MRKYYFIAITVSLFQIACLSSAQQTRTMEDQVKAQRVPVQRRNLVLKSPSAYSKRQLLNGKEYDPRPNLKLIDERAGKYEFSWIGYDGKKKTVIYEREDAIDAVVEARVEKDSEGKFAYKYLIRNLPESPTFLGIFAVQTISREIQPVRVSDVYIGDLSGNVEYEKGLWKGFAPVNKRFSTISAGKSIEYGLVSAANPGLVECRVSGGKGYTEGVGEHMPQELDNLVPVNLWAKCNTIGPVERLSQMSKSERAKYLLENLPKFLEAGWITNDAAKRYEAMFNKEDIAGAFERAKKDFASEVITSEVYHIIEGLNQQN